MQHIRIKSVDIYHPQKSVNNEFYIEHFRKQNKDIVRFLEVMGRKDRYVIDNDQENSLTMAVEATKRVLERAGMKGEDLDMIMFSTQTPEYTFPTNAMILHNMIGGKSKTICLDTNSNCAGMLVAVEQTCRYMQANPHVQKALVVGSDYNSINCNPNDEVTYSNYGDASSAVILEKVSEVTGFMDSLYCSETSGYENILFPACGLSNVYKQETKPEDIHIRWTPFDGTVVTDPAVADMKEIMEKHNLTLEDINAFCFSQFSLKNIELIQEKLGADLDKFVYVGDEFGYTGTSSPFIALFKGIESGKIKRGDYVFFWSVGAGWQIVTMLMKY